MNEVEEKTHYFYFSNYYAFKLPQELSLKSYRSPWVLQISYFTGVASTTADSPKHQNLNFFGQHTPRCKHKYSQENLRGWPLSKITAVSSTLVPMASSVMTF